MRRKKLIAVGIDPGSNFYGMSALEAKGAGLPPLLDSVHCPIPPMRRSARLLDFGRGVKAWLKKWRPKVVCIESGFIPHPKSRYKVNADSILSLSEFRGVARYLALEAKAVVVYVTPMQMRTGITLSRSATKDDIREMVANLWRLPFLPKEDEADSIALGVQAANHAQSEGLIGRKGW